MIHTVLLESVGWLGLFIRGYTLLRTAWYSKTQDALEYYPKYAAGKYRVILNPLNNSMLPHAMKGERSKRVVTVCRLNEQKNLPSRH